MQNARHIYNLCNYYTLQTRPCHTSVTLKAPILLAANAYMVGWLGLNGAFNTQFRLYRAFKVELYYSVHGKDHLSAHF